MLSDVEEKLKISINDEELFQKIMDEKKRWGTLSSSFLIRKFKFNEYYAKKIMKILGLPDKNVHGRLKK